MRNSSLKKPLLLKACAVFIFLVMASLGLLALYTGYAPERYTRFGYIRPLYEKDAHLFGLILITLSITPLLLLLKSKQQAIYLGSTLGLLIIIVIFGGIYIWH